MNRRISDFYSATKNRPPNTSSSSLDSCDYLLKPMATSTPIFHVYKKRYPRFPSIELPTEAGHSQGSIHALLNTRKSVRHFSKDKVSISAISSVLSSCFLVEDNRSPERRTYSSAGAKYPIEIYIVSLNVSGLEDKYIYHLNLDDKTLECLWDLKIDISDLVTSEIVSPAFAIVLSSVISRSEVKYRNKAYPFSLIEAGMIAQNIHLSASEIGLGTCMIGGFIDDSIIEALDFPDDEIPLLVISGGVENNKNF